jgi:predicted small lipoprotein YifL
MRILLITLLLLVGCGREGEAPAPPHAVTPQQIEVIK